MSTIILLITFSIIFGILLSMILGSRLKLPDPGKQKNKRKEKKLLQVLLKDMKENPGHWVQNGFSAQMLSSPTLINDKKNIGILYGEKENSASIQFNMKDVTKFSYRDPDTITTTIIGKHVTRFLKTATHLLDHRGKELEYFTKRLKKRL